MQRRRVWRLQGSSRRGSSVLLSSVLAVACASSSTHTRVDVDVAIRRTGGGVVVVDATAPRVATRPRAARAEPTRREFPRCAAGGTPAAIAQLAVGPSQTCTRHTDGSLCCWGAIPGSPGRGYDRDEHVERPSRVAAAGNVVAVGVGALHVCALAVDGSVWCWGDNGAGELGDGTTQRREEPAPVPGLANVDLLGVGQWHTCARVRGDGVRCWGGNLRANAAGRDTLVPTRVEGVDDVASFALGVDSCAITASRGLRCWGNALMYTYRRPDHDDPDHRDHYTLRALHDLAALSVGWSESGAGDAVACAVERGGTLWCWGPHLDGAHDREGRARSDRMVPVNVGGIRDATAVSASASQACVIRSGGKLWCWGRNDHGQVGDGTAVQRNVPVELPAHRDAIAVAVADDHTCAQTRDGAVWCWGRNDQGQLGDGTTEDRLVPTRVRW